MNSAIGYLCAPRDRNCAGVFERPSDSGYSALLGLIILPGDYIVLAVI